MKMTKKEVGHYLQTIMLEVKQLVKTNSRMMIYNIKNKCQRIFSKLMKKRKKVLAIKDTYNL